MGHAVKIAIFNTEIMIIMINHWIWGTYFIFGQPQLPFPIFSPHGLHFSTKHSQNVQAILHCGGPLPGCVQYLAAVLEQILCPRRLPCIYDFYESFSRLVKFSLFPTICIWLWHSSLFLSGQISLAAASRVLFWDLMSWYKPVGLFFFSNIELQEF